MKKLLVIIITLFNFSNFLILAQAASVTHDPINYTTALAKLAEITKLVQLGQEELTNTKKIVDKVGEFRENISTAYNNTFGVIGETKALLDQIKKTPSYLEKWRDNVMSLWNCIGSDLDQYSKLETLYTARYVTATPADHPFNFGSDPKTAGKGTISRKGKKDTEYNWGSQIAIQMADKPCGYKDSFYSQSQQKIETHKKATIKLMSIMDDSDVKEFSLSKEDFKKYEAHNKKIGEILSSTSAGKGVATLAAENKEILKLIYNVLKNISTVLNEVSNIYLEEMTPAPYAFKLTPEQQENINKMSNKELLENKNTNNLFDKMKKFGKTRLPPLHLRNIGSK